MIPRTYGILFFGTSAELSVFCFFLYFGIQARSIKLVFLYKYQCSLFLNFTSRPCFLVPTSRSHGATNRGPPQRDWYFLKARRSERAFVNADVPRPRDMDACWAISHIRPSIRTYVRRGYMFKQIRLCATTIAWSHCVWNFGQLDFGEKCNAYSLSVKHQVKEGIDLSFYIH